MARTARLSVEIDGRGARRGASGVSSELNRLKGDARGVTREFDLLGRAAQAAIGYFGIRELARFADEATNVRSRLNALSSSTGELTQHLRTVSDIAKETRSELGATSQLYATMTRSGDDLGLSQERIARITETVNKSFAVTGTDSATASQAIRQLNQAFQSGVLRGDEFNTMAEAAPVLMDALAKSMGIPRSQLRALAEDGKLTVDKLIAAFSDPNITAGIDAQFAKTIPTIGQRLTLLSNAAIEAIGRFDQMTGATQLLGAGIEGLASNLDTLIPLATALGIGFAAKIAIGAIQARLAILTMSAAAAGAVGPMAALGFTANAVKASLLGAFGGPIGIAIGATAFALFNLSQETANAEQRLLDNASAADSLGISLDETSRIALIAANENRGVGAGAGAAEPQIWSMKNAVDGLTGSLYEQARAARAARVELIQSDLAEATKINTDSYAATWDGSRANSRESNRLLLQGDISGSFSYGMSSIGSDMNNLLSGGRTGRDGRRDFNQSSSTITALQNKLADALYTPIGGKDLPPAVRGGNVGGTNGRSPKGGGSDGGVDKAAQEAKQLAQFAKQTTDQIAQMREQYDGTATDVAQVNALHRQLNDLTAELEEKKPALYKEMQADLKEVGRLADASLSKPFEAILKDQERQIELSQLSAAGRDNERGQLELHYQIMQQLGIETDEQLATAVKHGKITQAGYDKAIDNLAVQKQITADENQRNAVIQERLNQVDSIRQNIEKTIAELPSKGLNAIGNFFDDLFKQAKDYFARSITESLFGNVFKDLQAEITNSPVVKAELRVAEANNTYADSINKTSTALYDLEAAARDAKAGLDGSPVASNDNTGPLVVDEAPLSESIDVVGMKLIKPIAAELGASVGVALDENFDVFARTFTKLAERFLGEGSPLAKDIGKVVGGALEGAALGQFAGGAFGKTGGKIGGAVGGVLGGVNKLLGPDSPLQGIMAALPQIGAALQINATISSLLGGDQVKNGKVLGVLFPFLTPLLGSALRGSATIGSVNGELGITGTRGNSAARKAASTDSANSVIEQLRSIASQLGVDLDSSKGSASIGIRKKQYVLDPTGQGRTKGAGTIKLGKGEAGAEAAARALALNLIEDGVLAGLREGSKKLLQNSKSLEAGLEKALKFEDVFRQLREIDDPIGAAVESVNKEFEGLIKIFKEAGASSAEYADLERLYQIKRTNAIEEANERLLGSMRDYIFQLTAGPQSVLSPQLRYQNSRAELDSLDAKRAAGGNVDFGQYRNTSEAFLAASRDYQGSTTGYFNDMARITTTVQNWIASEQARASQTLATVDFTGLTTAVNNQTTAQTAILNTIATGISNLNTQLTALNDNVAGSFAATGTSDTRYYQNF